MTETIASARRIQNRFDRLRDLLQNPNGHPEGQQLHIALMTIALAEGVIDSPYPLRNAHTIVAGYDRSIQAQEDEQARRLARQTLGMLKRTNWPENLQHIEEAINECSPGETIRPHLIKLLAQADDELESHYQYPEPSED